MAAIQINEPVSISDINTILARSSSVSLFLFLAMLPPRVLGYALTLAPLWPVSSGLFTLAVITFDGINEPVEAVGHFRVNAVKKLVTACLKA